MRRIGNKQTNTRQTKNNRKIPDMKHHVDKHNSAKKPRGPIEDCHHEGPTERRYPVEFPEIYSDETIGQECTKNKRVINLFAGMRTISGFGRPMYRIHHEYLPLEPLLDAEEKAKNISRNTVNCATNGLNFFNSYAGRISCRSVNVSEALDKYRENSVDPYEKILTNLLNKTCIEFHDVSKIQIVATSDCRPNSTTTDSGNRNLVVGASVGIAIASAIIFCGAVALACGALVKKRKDSPENQESEGLLPIERKRTNNEDIEKSSEEIQAENNYYQL